MNYYKIFTWCILLSWIAFAGCDDEKDLNLNLTEVKTLIAPEDNLSVKLDLLQNPSVTFQWDQARAEDGSLVLYEIVFDQEDGNFSSPFFKTTSGRKGIDNELTLSHVELNSIAKAGGAAFFEKKKFKWTVLASKGSNVKLSDQVHVIEIERPDGFEVIPAKLYITGAATEGGADVANALEMKKTAPGKFEIYTRLIPGTYKFVDATGSGANTFFIAEEGGFKKISVDGETTYSGDEKVYRIQLDFDAITARIDEVKSVGFWYCWENKIMYDLNYAGEGIWRVDDVTVTLSSVPWGLEERHKYKMVLNDGVSDFEQWWGYVSNDSPGQDGQYGVADPSYFYAYPIEGNDQWNYAWKLDRPAIQGKNADFLLKFPGGDTPYAMEYIIHN